MDRIEQLKQALLKAHQAGDFEAATLFADTIKAEQSVAGKSDFNQWDENKQAVKRGAKTAKDLYTGAVEETWNDPKQAGRGWLGLAGDLAASVPGSIYAGIEGVSKGIQDRSVASGLQEFENAIGSYLGRYSPSQFLDQKKLQASKVYQAGGAAMEVPEDLVKMAGKGIGIAGDALVTGTLDNAGQGPVARELGAVGQIGASIAAGLRAGGYGKSPGRIMEGPALPEPPLRGPQFNPLNEMDQLSLPFPGQKQGFGGKYGGAVDPNLPNMPLDENGIPFDREATSMYGAGDTQQAVGIIDPTEAAMLGDPINDRVQVPTSSTQLNLFGAPQGAVDTGLASTSGRTGSTINATVERLSNGEFVERRVPANSKVRYKGIPKEVVALAEKDPQVAAGLDYWQSRLEDQNLIYDKAQFDNHTRKDLKDIGNLLEEINRLDAERKQTLVDLSTPNEYASLEGDKVYRFNQVNDANEAKIQPLVQQLDSIWAKLQARMDKREKAPKTRNIFPNDDRIPAQAGALTVQTTDRPNLGRPEGDRTPFNPNLPYSEYVGLEGDLGSRTSLEPRINEARGWEKADTDHGDYSAEARVGNRVLDSFRQGDVRGSLIHIAASGNAFERKVANFYLQNLGSLGEVKLRWLQDMSDSDIANYNRSRAYEDKVVDRETPRAWYAGNLHTIVFSNIPAESAARLFLHEMTHAFTHGYVNRAINFDSGGWGRSPFAASSAKRIVDLYEEVKKKHPELAGMYGMTDANEFIAEAFSNEAFRKELSKISVSSPGSKLVKSAWTSFVQSVAGLLRNLGLDINIQNKNEFNALSELLNEGARIIEQGSAADRTLYKTRNTKKDLVFAKLDSAVRKGNLASTAARMAKEFDIDRRSIGEVVKDLGITPQNVREKMPDVSNFFVKGTKAVVDRAISVLSERAGPVHDLIKNVIDRQQIIEREMREGMEQFSVGVDWKANRFGIESRQDSGGVLTALKKENITIPQAIGMKKIWLENVAGPRELHAGDFDTTAQWKAYSTIQSNLKKMWDQTNEMRAKAGIPTIPYIRNYFPSQWEGDYRVFIRNGQNELIDVRGARTRREARKLAQALQKEANDQGKTDFTFTPDLASKSVRDVADLSMMDDIMRALQNHPQAHAAMQKVYANVANKRGFGSTALQRKGVMGALGYEEGELGLRRMQKSLETYINRQQTYVANLKRQFIKNELAGLPQEIQKAIPNALKVMHDYLDHAKGKTSKDWMDAVAEGIGEAIGQGDSAAVRLIHRSSRAATFMVLATTNFIASQFFQPVFAIPRLVKMKALGETNQSATVAFFKGYTNYIAAMTGDTSLRGAVNWARKNGFIEPALMQVMNDHMRDSAFRTENKISGAVDKSQSMFGLISGGVEEWTVRAPTFFVFEQALRDSIKDPVKRYEKAGNLTDYYMVHYSQEALPMMYTQVGQVVGETFKPLKQFAHQYYGMFLEYLDFMAEGKDFKSTLPLISFMTTSMLLGGVASFVGSEAINAIIAVMNFIMEKGFGRDKTERIPNVKDLVASTNFGSRLANDVITFGVPSGLSGANISAAISAPQMSQLFQIPIGPSYWGKAIDESLSYLSKSLSGTATEADEMKMFLATSPLALRGTIEQMYSPDGSTIPNPNDQMRPFYRRDEKEQVLALAGLRTTDEARYRQLVSAAKMLAMSEREHRMEVMNKIYDEVLQGKPLDSALIDKYIDAGGDPRNLVSNLKARMMTQDTTWAERQMQSRPSPTSVNDRAAVQKFMGTATSPHQDSPPSREYRMGNGESSASPVSRVEATTSAVQEAGRKQGTNLQFPAYSESVDKINFKSMPYGIGGYVDQNDPSTVNMNPNSVFRDQRKTYGHEATHSQQNAYTKFLKESKDKGDYPPFTHVLGIGGNLGGYGRVADIEQAIYKRLGQVPEELLRKYELGAQFSSKSREFTADLQGVEASLPAGQTILDTDLGEFLFRTPQERRYYLASSLPMTRKLLEYDPSLIDLAVQKARLAKKEFKNAAVSTSYLRAAMKAIQKSKSP